MSQQHYEPEFKQQIVRLHIEEGRTYRSLTAEDGASKCLLQLPKAQTSKSDRPKTGYPASIIDLHDRSVVASLTDRHMTSDLAIRTLGKALSGQRKKTKGLILYSDQGSPYTSKAFTDFCEEHDLTQSMSKAGCPYDNAPMERYFNTLKNKEIYLHEYRDEESLYRAVEHFAYTTYNHVRPHSYNGYRTPFEARYST